MYVCGPTTYNFIHLGNSRPAVAYDVVARHLRARGFKVTYVRNITDVDDKIIKRANELGESFLELTQRFTREYQHDVGSVGCMQPDLEPKVSDHIGEIVAMIARLVKNGVAYASEGDVYFAVRAFPHYGELSHQPLEQLESGARVEVGEKK